MTPNLIIHRPLFRKIIRHARRSVPDECMGLLARRPRGHPGKVTAICQLPALATPGHAEAAPIHISSAVRRLRSRGLVPMGIWHSHGEGGVHHSLQDDETITRFLPAMAEDNYQRPRDALLTPSVRSPDEADLPLPDGTTLHFTLLGPSLPGLDGRQRIAWTSIATHFRERSVRPRAVVNRGHLQLAGGQVVLTLGLPAGSTLESHVVDRAPVRSAHLYSLVVNAAGDAHLEVLTIHDIDGQTVVQQSRSSVDVIHDGSASGIPATTPRTVNSTEVTGPGRWKAEARPVR
jgi:proteasome lid subunit RPN8/RPN11